MVDEISPGPRISPRSGHTKDLKWYLIPPCLTLGIRRFVSRVKWSNQNKEVAVAIENGAFGSPSTTDHGRQPHFFLQKPQ